jgi:hypothetical protein
MSHAATIEDVHRYSPTVRRIDDVVTHGVGPVKRAPEYKKAEPKRTHARKAAGKRVAVKKSTAKRSGSKRAR